MCRRRLAGSFICACSTRRSACSVRRTAFSYFFCWQMGASGAASPAVSESLAVSSNFRRIPPAFGLPPDFSLSSDFSLFSGLAACSTRFAACRFLIAVRSAVGSAGSSFLSNCRREPPSEIRRFVAGMLSAPRIADVSRLSGLAACWADFAACLFFSISRSAVVGSSGSSLPNCRREPPSEVRRFGAGAPSTPRIAVFSSLSGRAACSVNFVLCFFLLVFPRFWGCFLTGAGVGSSAAGASSNGISTAPRMVAGASGGGSAVASARYSGVSSTSVCSALVSGAGRGCFRFLPVSAPRTAGRRMSSRSVGRARSKAASAVRWLTRFSSPVARLCSTRPSRPIF